MEPLVASNGTGPVVAVDIGNTRTKVGRVTAGHCGCVGMEAFPTRELGARLLPAITSLLSAETGVVPVVIAGVVDRAAERAGSLLAGAGFAVHRLTAQTAMPFSVRYERPETIGVDRVANALYAVSRFPGRAITIIGAGTAIVVDLVADRTFYGGAILPGIRLQFESLHRATDALPLVAVSGSMEIPRLPAHSTRDCIAGGIVRGCAAALDALVAGYAAEDPAAVDRTVLATGGDWELLAPLVKFKCTVIPDMTLAGIALSLPLLQIQ